MTKPTPAMPTLDHVRLGSGCRTVFPAAARERFDLKEGSELLVEVDEFGVHFFTFEQAIRRSRAIAAKYVDPSVSLVDELIKLRREEAARE